MCACMCWGWGEDYGGWEGGEGYTGSDTWTWRDPLGSHRKLPYMLHKGVWWNLKGKILLRLHRVLIDEWQDQILFNLGRYLAGERRKCHKSRWGLPDNENNSSYKLPAPLLWGFKSWLADIWLGGVAFNRSPVDLQSIRRWISRPLRCESDRDNPVSAQVLLSAFLLYNREDRRQHNIF